MSLLNQPTPDAQPAAQATPPVEPSAPAQEQAKEVQPLTEAEYRRIAREEAQRTAQSLVDKAEYRISKKAQEQIRALEVNRSVLGLSDDQVQQAKLKILTEDVTAEPPTPQASEPTPEAEPEGGVIGVISSIFQEEGVTLEPNDPEYKTFEDQWNNPNGSMTKLVKATYSAIEAKRQRLQKIDTTAAFRTPGGAGGGSTPSNTAASAHELWDTAYTK